MTFKRSRGEVKEEVIWRDSPDLSPKYGSGGSGGLGGKGPIGYGPGGGLLKGKPGSGRG